MDRLITNMNPVLILQHPKTPDTVSRAVMHQKVKIYSQGLVAPNKLKMFVSWVTTVFETLIPMRKVVKNWNKKPIMSIISTEACRLKSKVKNRNRFSTCMEYCI